jgi:GxxExxY protein
MEQYPALDKDTERIAAIVVDAAICVHKLLGPGLLESIYERSLTYELNERGIDAKRQVHMPVWYKDIEFPYGYRMDILVEDQIIIELKSVDTLLTVHRAQLLTYLRLSSKRLGFLMNFNVPILKNGIKRVIL